MDSSITAENLTKVFNPFPFRKKERGPGLWVANIVRLKRSKEYEVVALNGVSFSVSKGEVFAIVGPNSLVIRTRAKKYSFSFSSSYAKAKKLLSLIE